jgi:uncharacterized protein (TIGR02599 family)
MTITSAPDRRRSGFTLVEVLASLAVLSVMVTILTGLLGQTMSTWQFTTSKAEEFRGARAAFDSMTRRLSQATLNTYWDYDSPTAPTKYLRQSDLRFLACSTRTLEASPLPAVARPTHGVFFQAPLGYVNTTDFEGLTNLLNTWGYFVEFNSDQNFRPPFLTPAEAPIRHRYRLMELMEPSNELSIYKFGAGKTWIENPLNFVGDPSAKPPLPSKTHVLAENVVALILLPKLATKEDPSGIALAPNYTYDSTTTNTNPALNTKNQLPPLVQVTLIAIDEKSAARLTPSSFNGGTPPVDLLDPARFAAAVDYEEDLAETKARLEGKDLVSSTGQSLANRPLNYRIFTTHVSLRAAKWSRN